METPLWLEKENLSPAFVSYLAFVVFRKSLGARVKYTTHMLCFHSHISVTHLKHLPEDLLLQRPPHHQHNKGC